MSALSERLLDGSRSFSFLFFLSARLRDLLSLSLFFFKALSFASFFFLSSLSLDLLLSLRYLSLSLSRARLLSRSLSRSLSFSLSLSLSLSLSFFRLSSSLEESRALLSLFAFASFSLLSFLLGCSSSDSNSFFSFLLLAVEASESDDETAACFGMLLGVNGSKLHSRTRHR